MNWKSINFDWNRTRAFLVTAEEGSYSKAAKALGMSQPTLGRQVTALEEELGVVLFEKLGNALRLTPTGHNLLEHVKQMADAANQFSLAAEGQSNELEGRICISATDTTAVYVLAPMMRKLRLRAPGITVEIVASNQASDLRKREADIAIRNFEPRHADLIARKMKTSRAYLYATPNYLQQFGDKPSKESFVHADFVGFNDSTPYLGALQEAGFPVSESNVQLITESHIVHWEIVKSGAAIGIMPDYIGDQEPSVQRIIQDMEPLEFETWLVVHRELRTNPKVRLVYDFLAEQLEAVLR